MKRIGIILVLLGILLFIIPGSTSKMKEKEKEVRSDYIITDQTRFQWPAYVGSVFILGGIVILGTRLAQRRLE